MNRMYVYIHMKRERQRQREMSANFKELVHTVVRIKSEIFRQAGRLETQGRIGTVVSSPKAVWLQNFFLSGALKPFS